jgi:hypothetical protein
MDDLDLVVRDLQDRIDRLDLTPALQRISDMLSGRFLLGFQTSSDPRGNPWPRLKVITAERRRYGTMPLIMTRALMAAAASRDRAAPGAIREIEGNVLTYGVDDQVIPYARKHQLGGTFNGRPVPPRPFLGLSAAAEREAEDIATRHILDVLGAD